MSQDSQSAPVQQSDFSIRKESRALIINIVAFVFLVELAFLVFVLSITALRSGGDFNAFVFLIYIGVFFFKTGFESLVIYRIMRTWLGTDYYVIQRQLIIDSHFDDVPSSARALAGIIKVEVQKPSMLNRSLDYGNVTLYLAAGQGRPLVLSNVSHPEAIAAVLKQQSHI